MVRSINLKTYLLLFLTSLALISGCSLNTAGTENGLQFLDFEETLGVSELPEGLVLEVITSRNEIIEGNAIELILSNKSVHTILFVPGYGSQLFAYNSADESWEDVENLVDYVGNGDVLAPQSRGTKNWAAHLTVKPNLQPSNSYSVLRIAIAGIALEDTAQHKVGAFIDIPLVSN